MAPSKCVKRMSFLLLLSVLMADILIVNSFYSNTATLSRMQSCSSPNIKPESDCITVHKMVPQGGLDIEVTNLPIEKWYPAGDDLSIPAPLNQLVDVNLERRSVIYEVTLGRDIGIEIVQGSFGPIIGQVTFHRALISFMFLSSVYYVFCYTQLTISVTPLLRCNNQTLDNRI